MGNDESMSGEDSPTVIALRAAVNEALASFSDDTAIFCAERLYAETGAGEELRMLCTCYMRTGQDARAYRLLKLPNDPEITSHPQTVFLFAKICYKLNRYDEAEAVLTGAPRSLERTEFDTGRRTVANGSYGLELLGEICRRTGRTKRARDYFTQAIQLNPALWSAFKALCDLGGGASLDMQSALPSIQTVVAQKQADQTPDHYRGSPAGGALLFTPGTPLSAMASPAYNPPMDSKVPPPVMPRNACSKAGMGPPEPIRANSTRAARTPGPGGGLFYEPRQTRSRTAQGSDWLRTLARTYALMSEYQLTQACEEIENLEPCHASSPLTLAMLGRAQFEMTLYKQAEKSFKAALQLDPLCPEAIDVYSTTLWHLKKDLELSQLSQDVIQDNRKCPQAWCALGNCFSLQQDHDTAIKFFDRAVQLDQHYSMAYTLCGHEQAANEEHERAMSYYRNALRQDERNYKAWFGLGTVYQRQEKHEAAELHFQQAIGIHSTASVLHCWLGIVRDEAHSYVQALQPKEAELYLQLGKAYKKLGQHHNARLQLMLAWDLDPKSSNRIKSEIEHLDNPVLDLDCP